MLELMRKHAKSWMMKVILGLIIVVFIFYFGSTSGDRGAEAIVKINGKTISYADFHKKYSNLYDTYRQYFGGNLPEEFLKKLDLKQQTLDSLINEVIIVNKATELGITADDDEVRNSIMQYPAFQRDGAFDERLYQQVLRHNKLTPEDFEKNQKQAIVASKLEALIKGGAQVSDQELFDIYSLQNGKINVDFLRISSKDLAGSIKPSNAELDKFLKDNGEMFRVPEKMQAKYIFFASEAYALSVHVSDNEVSETFSLHKAQYEKSGNKALTADLKTKIANEIRLAKAMEIAFQEVKKARDVVYQYDNFEEHAKKNNLQVHSTEYFPVNQPPAEFSQIKDIRKHLADLKKGELGPILSVPKGYFLLKISDTRSSYIPKLDDIRAEVSQKYIEKESRILAGKESEKMLENLKKGQDYKKAQAKNIQWNETGYFVPGINIPKIGSSKELALALYQLSDKRPYPDKAFMINGDYIIVRLKGRAAVDRKDFEANKTGLKTSYLKMKETAYFQSWLSGQKEALLKKGDLKIYKQPSEL
jgi:peptidyl-prolyl cis-trans isomerase D